MGFPIYRPRRLRATENLRSMIRETELSVKDLIYPLFVVPGTGVKNEIESLPGNYHWSLDRLPEVYRKSANLEFLPLYCLVSPLIKMLSAAAPGMQKNLYSRPAA